MIVVPSSRFTRSSNHPTIPGFVHTSFVGKEDGTMPTKYDQDTKAKAIRLVRDHSGDYNM